MISRNSRLVFSVLAVAVWASLAGCGDSVETISAAKADPLAHEEISVTVAEARVFEIDRSVEIVGTLLAEEEVTLSNEVKGRVVDIMVDFGDGVTRGEHLLSLDRTEYQLAVERAQAALGQALAAFGLPPDGDESEVVIDQTPAVVQASASLADAKEKLESARQLVRTKDIPLQRYLELEKTTEQREAALREARDRVRVQLANVRLQRAMLALELERLEDTRIFAPFSGSVAQRHVAPGQLVGENSPLLTIVRTNPLRLRGRVPEGGVGAVREGLKVQFETDAYPDHRFDAVVSKVSPVLDSKSRTLMAEAKVPNHEGLLKPGMFVRITAVVAEASPTVMVPQAAVLSYGGLRKVFVVRPDGDVNERVVEVGHETEGRVEVLGGTVSEGDLVATSLLEQLREGARVQITRK